MQTALDAALAAVSERAYVLEPDGSVLPQSSSPQIIAAMLRLLEVPVGVRVLEIGTGSAYSTALLAHLAGASGQVISLDINPELAERANRLLRQQSLQQATAQAADGRAGWSEAAPFERIVAWATGEVLPHAWVRQLTVGGLIVAPLRLALVAGATAIVRARCNGPASLAAEHLLPGGFTALTSVPKRQWAGLVEEADIVAGEGEAAAWLSSEWLRGAGAGETSMRRLLESAAPCAGPLRAGEDAGALRAYLLAQDAAGLTSGSTPATGLAIGCSRANSLALLSLHNGTLVKAGAETANETLIQWIAAWRDCGRPGFESLQPSLERDSPGWKLRARLTQ